MKSLSKDEVKEVAGGVVTTPPIPALSGPYPYPDPLQPRGNIGLTDALVEDAF